MPRSPALRRPGPPRPIRALAVALMLAVLGLAATARAQGADANLSKDQAARFAEQALAWQRQLSDQVMPYWYDHAVDRDFGGYVLEDAISPEKLVVTQARLVWGFAHAYRVGLRDPSRDYLGAAGQGYRFLQEHFLDRKDGGYFWTTNRVGQVINDRKFLYGQAFVIYALVEYYRASGDPEALRQATELYQTVQMHCRDAVHGGWGEHFEADWRRVPVAVEGGITGSGSPALATDQVTGVGSRVDIGIIGTKSGDALVHWIEALTELELTTHMVGGDAAVHDLGLDAALAEALDLARTYFFPDKPGQAYPYRYPDWRRPIGGRFKEISYGDNVEFAWLMLAAERALGQPPSWDRFDAILQHALRYAYDHEHGGLSQLGFDNRPASVTDKVWWVQAELLAALTESLSQRPSPDYAQALDQLLGFLTAHQIDPRDGIWFDTVAADGSLRRPAKAHNWKASYHDLRAMTKFVETFGAGQAQAR